MNEWISFMLYAVLGKMREADAIMREHRQAVGNFAALLEARFGPAPGTETGGGLWRGVLSERPPDARFPGVEFVSYSESREVACWFAEPTSFISKDVIGAMPNVKPWILRLGSDQPRRVLFHYRWRHELPLVEWGLLHPHIAPQIDQLAWNLKTQYEVILAPGPVPEVMPLESLPDRWPVERLDAEFTHPAFRGTK